MQGRLRRGLILTLAWCAILAGPARGEDNWPQWRGPRGDGHTDAKLPLKWNDDSVVWKTALPGEGQSSPVVWGDRIYLTAAMNLGAKRVVVCLSRQTGDILWERTAWEGPAEDSHPMNHWASATCVTDGERVIAFFGRAGMHCYSMDGDKLWSLELGGFKNPWGTAASPLIVEGLVVQNCDSEDKSFLAGIDKKTGSMVWSTPRDKLRGWSTPLLVDTGDALELVLNGERGIHCYEPRTGRQLWFRRGDTGRGTPTVTPAGKLLVVVNGRAGDMFAVDHTGAEQWRTKRRGGRDLPSPIVVGEHLIVVSLRPGMATGYRVQSGEELGRLRLEGAFSASPIAAGEHAYIPNEDGEVFVLTGAPNGVQVVARNKLTPRAEAEIFRASLTPLSDGRVLLRSTKTLYCVK